MNTWTDKQLLTQLCHGDPIAFECIYIRYIGPILRYALRRLKSKEDCEEIVQDLFVALWEKRESLLCVISLRAYLYGVIRHKIADCIALKAQRNRYVEHFMLFESVFDTTTEDQIHISDISIALDCSLDHLPVICQKVFRLSRFEHMPNYKIAEQMNLSIGTVENYISKASKHVRGFLSVP